MNISSSDRAVVAWNIPPMLWSLYAGLAGILAITFYDGLKEMVRIWNTQPEYGHGYIIPLLSIFLIWQKKNLLEKVPFKGTWSGMLFVLLGLILFFLGELSTLYIIVQYAFLLVLWGMVLALAGWKVIKIIWAPLVFLVFMIPLPTFLYNDLSSHLQLISSQLGVGFIRWCDISVFLEGNLIDLGSYKLQVVEACSGLRYLFPLMSLAFICAYFFKGRLWQRGLIFLSSIPITIFMNSFRIGVIGVLVDYWGPSMAEGFLHDFEGWVIFMACTAVLVMEMWILAKIGREARPLRMAFGLEFPKPVPQNALIRPRRLTKPLKGTTALVVAAMVSSILLDERSEVIPPREDFARFPMTIGAWQGTRDHLQQNVLKSLRLDDYILADYADPAGYWVNFYSAYYASQRTGESAHSPRSCIPGGGWLIKELSLRTLDGIKLAGKPLRVNRVLIQKGEYKQVVYYWFQQRGRIITNEYLVKWYLFWDALTRHRTDGALVRLITPVDSKDQESAGDHRLEKFAEVIAGNLEGFIPG